ncbi:MAG: hypothetical protein JXB34_06390 [Bacteroidales bacterium]|nr:hypothetical protein [Bacteroidales bacterium]
MKNKYILVLVFIFISFTGYAQEEAVEKSPGLMVFGVPQYILTNGLRIDFDLHKKGTQNWIVLSPYYYSDNSSADLLNLGGSDEYFDVYNYDKLTGAGLGILKKTFLSKKSLTEGFYLAYGGSYKYFDIDGNSYTWIEFTGTDGLVYQKMADLKYDLYIHSINANAIIGYQLEANPSLFFDFFCGFGLRYSIHSSPQNVTTKYNRGYYDYGYTGTQFIAGLRVGILL